MGVAFKLSFLVLIISVIYGYMKFLSVPAPVPKLEETWWGPGDSSKEDTQIRPFKINISENVIQDLYTRLDNHIPLQPALEGVNQHYGIHSDHLQGLINFWRTKYDWKERQKFLNQFPQYTVSVQGLQIHYLHVKPKNVPANVKVLPLLLLHGWPGSVREFYELIPILTTPQKGKSIVFEVIAPSLPGYTFSEAAVRPGLGAAQMATIFKNLMKRLKFDKFYIQGGDWGALIVKNMAILYPDHVIGMHSNMCFVNTAYSNFILFVGQVLPWLVATPQEQQLTYPLTNMYHYILLETGYMHIQATKPDTIGAAVRDSPVGLLAYMMEKFSTWTNPAYKDLPDGGLSKKFDVEDLLDNVMMYWVTRSMTTSMRLYAESFNSAQLALKMDQYPVKVPTACARFTHELAFPLKKVLETAYHNLIQVTTHEGGHFAAFEVPEVLADDIYLFVATNELLNHQKKNKV